MGRIDLISYVKVCELSYFKLEIKVCFQNGTIFLLLIITDFRYIYPFIKLASSSSENTLSTFSRF